MPMDAGEGTVLSPDAERPSARQILAGRVQLV
jgi:hypothetical protein